MYFTETQWELCWHIMCSQQNNNISQKTETACVLRMTLLFKMYRSLTGHYFVRHLSECIVETGARCHTFYVSEYFLEYVWFWKSISVYVHTVKSWLEIIIIIKKLLNMSSIIAQEKKMQVICFTIHKVVLLCSPLVFPKSIGEKRQYWNMYFCMYV